MMAFAITAGLATFIGLHFILMVVYGMACGASQFLNMLLRFSYFAWPIKIACWFGIAWMAISVFDALS